jgi:glycosyltransferase involved in cell wall biosynthesis
MTAHRTALRPTLSIGILAWNEEKSIRPMLDSLLRQTVFHYLAVRGEGCEIVCLANGCTDGTVAAATGTFAEAKATGLLYPNITGWAEDIREPGRNNAWNRFVHEISYRETRFICFMDADIVLNQPHTLEILLRKLESNSHLGAVSDCPVKDITLKPRPSVREKLSMATSDMTNSIEGRLNGMLYVMRSPIARNLYLPRDLGANDDGFFKAAICTDFFRERLDRSRVQSVGGATHLYQPYLRLHEILNNQKRQMIGQTSVHVLVEHLKGLPEAERTHLAATLRRKEEMDPDWLKRLIEAHVARTRHFWQLFPGILGFRWARLRRMRGIRKVTHFPAFAAGFVVTLFACWKASRFLRRGVTNYWPKAARQTVPTSSEIVTKQPQFS